MLNAPVLRFFFWPKGEDRIHTDASEKQTGGKKASQASFCYQLPVSNLYFPSTVGFSLK